jgi:hypothetical protein
MTSNNNGRHKLEEEVDSSMARNRLRLSDDDRGKDGGGGGVGLLRVIVDEPT